MINKSIIAAATLTLSVVTFSAYAVSATNGPAGTQNTPSYSKPSNVKFDRLSYNEGQQPRKPRLKRKIVKIKSEIEISCKEGRLIVARQGFEAVHTLKCQGRNFTYVAMLDGDLVSVNVNRRGDIVGMNHM